MRVSMDTEQPIHPSFPEKYVMD